MITKLKFTCDVHLGVYLCICTSLLLENFLFYELNNLMAYHIHLFKGNIGQELQIQGRIENEEPKI